MFYCMLEGMNEEQKKKLGLETRLGRLSSPSLLSTALEVYASATRDRRKRAQVKNPEADCHFHKATEHTENPKESTDK